PKSKQNFTIGIRLPWTLASEENWNKTHRFAGWVWTIGSLILIITSIIGFSALTIFIVITALMSIIPIVYSYIYYQKEEETKDKS
ncbi:MAG: SdpI family protein, partial [Bacteroidia bacterium]|nr:SdpI family protein [Bacteroidia bacterium]